MASIIISVGGLLRLAVLILSLACRLHFLDQVGKEFLELFIFLADLNDLRLNHLDTSGVAPYLILDLHDLFKDNLPDFVEALHVGLLRLVLLEGELTLDLIVARGNNLLHSFLEVVHALGQGLVQGLHVLLHVFQLVLESLGIRIEVLEAVF